MTSADRSGMTSKQYALRLGKHIIWAAPWTNMLMTTSGTPPLARSTAQPYTSTLAGTAKPRKGRALRRRSSGTRPPARDTMYRLTIWSA